jgi:hypothetical protein
LIHRFRISIKSNSIGVLHLRHDAKSTKRLLWQLSRNISIAIKLMEATILQCQWRKAKVRQYILFLLGYGVQTYYPSFGLFPSMYILIDALVEASLGFIVSQMSCYGLYILWVLNKLKVICPDPRLRDIYPHNLFHLLGGINY